MNSVVAVLEDEAQAAYNLCDNGLYLELRKYIINFKGMMNDLAYRLPGLIAVDFQGGVHPLVAAYVIYKDAKRHRDLGPRNIIRLRMAVLAGSFRRSPQYEPVVITVGGSELTTGWDGLW